MNIAVFCSAYSKDEEHVKAAQEVAKIISKGGHNLVWGGSYTGIMKVISDGVREGGGKLFGISIERYRDNNHKSADEMIIAKTLGDRKAAMLDKSDLILVLPGGVGTLDEVTDVLELRKQGHHNKDIVVLNLNGFWDGLKTQLEAIKNGFISEEHDLSKLIHFINRPAEISKYLN